MDQSDWGKINYKENQNCDWNSAVKNQRKHYFVFGYKCVHLYGSCVEKKNESIYFFNKLQWLEYIKCSSNISIVLNAITANVQLYNPIQKPGFI